MFYYKDYLLYWHHHKNFKYFRYIGNVELMILFEGKNCPVGRYKYICTYNMGGSGRATTPSPGVVM